MTCMDIIVNNLVVFLSLIVDDVSKVKNGHRIHVFNATMFLYFTKVDPTKFDGQ